MNGTQHSHSHGLSSCPRTINQALRMKHPKATATRHTILAATGFAFGLLWSILALPTWAVAKDYTFSWTPNTDTIEGYRLYYKKGGEPAPPFDGQDAENGPSPIRITDPAASSITLTGLEDNTTYHFALSAYNGADESDLTGAISVFYTPAYQVTAHTRNITFTWEASPADISQRNFYLNSDLVCSTQDTSVTSLTCPVNIVPETMIFTMTTVTTEGTEGEPANLFTLDPFAYPDLFAWRLGHFTWQYDNDTSSINRFRLYQNDQLLCETSDANAREMSCSLLLEDTNTFTITAEGFDGTETTLSDNFTLSVSPTETATETLHAQISTSATQGTTPLQVNFSADSSQGAITSYAWSFGDGNTSSESNPSHTFTEQGEFNVTLTISDEQGNFASATTVITTLLEETAAGGTEKGPTITSITAVISSSTSVEEQPPSEEQFSETSTTITTTGGTEKLFTFTWDLPDDTTATSLRFYLNNELLCEKDTPPDTGTLSCQGLAPEGPLTLSMTTINSDSTETEISSYVYDNSN